VDGLKRRFQITHPFHPLSGQEFELVDYQRSWGKDCVYGQDAQGRLLAVPLAWTDAVEPDPAVVLSAGRSPFRFQDLLALADLIAQIAP
jgi:hypothetical protein